MSSEESGTADECSKSLCSDISNKEDEATLGENVEFAWLGRRGFGGDINSSPESEVARTGGAG